MKLSGKVVLITGAARGMGQAIAQTFTQDGAAAGLLDIQADELAAVQETIQAEGGQALACTADVRDAVQVQDAVQTVIKALGPIDILVNAAGLITRGKVHKMTEADWDHCFDVNVKGTFLTCRAVVPGMIERQTGHIINIASLSAWIRGFPSGVTAYTASKYAVRGFSRCLAVELRSDNIKVTCLSPGSTDSHFRGQPSGNPNLMTPDDVAQAVLFVATQREPVAVAELAFSMINEAW